MPDTILLVDDDPLIHQLYSAYLARAGFQVLNAYTGQEALQLALKDKPRMILLDVKLPDLDGMSVLRELKSQSATEQIAVVMITSLTEYRMCEEEARTLGAAAFLPKPFGPAQLVTEIRLALRVA